MTDKVGSPWNPLLGHQVKYKSGSLILDQLFLHQMKQLTIGMVVRLPTNLRLLMDHPSHLQTNLHGVSRVMSITRSHNGGTSGQLIKITNTSPATLGVTGEGRQTLSLITDLGLSLLITDLQDLMIILGVVEESEGTDHGAPSTKAIILPLPIKNPPMLTAAAIAAAVVSDPAVATMHPQLMEMVTGCCCPARRVIPSHSDIGVTVAL